MRKYGGAAVLCLVTSGLLGACGGAGGASPATTIIVSAAPGMSDATTSPTPQAASGNASGAKVGKPGPSSSRTAVVVPDVEGMSEDAATREVVARGLRARTVTRDVLGSDGMPPVVEAQNPVAGAKVTPGSTVLLHVISYYTDPTGIEPESDSDPAAEPPEALDPAEGQVDDQDGSAVVDPEDTSGAEMLSGTGAPTPVQTIEAPDAGQPEPPAETIRPSVEVVTPSPGDGG